jgi:hypothetical protein
MQIRISPVDSLLWQVTIDGAKVGSPGVHPWGAKRNALACLRSEQAMWRRMRVSRRVCASRREAVLAYALLRG